MSTAASSKSTKKKEKSNFIHDFVKVTGLPSMALWLRPKVIRAGKNTKIKGGYMVFANHSSFIDPLLIHCIFYNRRIHCLATKDVYDTPFKRFACENMLCIQVDKENFSVDSFHEVVRLLKAGKVISIFPEGRVILGSEEIHTFKSGVVLMAYTAGAPILPVYIVPNRKWYNRRIAVIGDPIDIREMCGKRPSTADFDSISRYLQEKEVELKRYYHENYDKADNDIETNSNKKEEVLK